MKSPSKSYLKALDRKIAGMAYAIDVVWDVAMGTGGKSLERGLKKVEAERRELLAERERVARLLIAKGVL
jgi:hypothetical protein